MELNHFARIGKGVLSKAIGLQANHIEYYEKGPDTLDEPASGCYGCQIHQLKDELTLLGLSGDADRIHTMCRECSASVWKPSYTRKVYVNERNRYGYQPTLKTNAIKLLLLYHFLQPDAQGFIRNVNVKELAATLGCSLPTILSCNRALQKYDYCYTCDGMFSGTINVFLPEYKNYHKTAAEGGRGYITMSDSMLDKLLGISLLNTLRLNLKGVLVVDNASCQEAKNAPLRPVTSTYSSLRGFLPKYCKRNIIKTALMQDDSIFQLDFQEKTVAFHIREEYAQRKLRDAMVADTAEELMEYVETVNDLLEMADDAILPVEREPYEKMLSAFHIETSPKYPPLSLKITDYEDLASLAVQYNIHMVRVALGHIYSKYVCRNHPVDSMGALARTFIRNYSVFSNAA